MLIPKQGVCYHTARRPGSYNVTVPKAGSRDEPGTKVVRVNFLVLRFVNHFFWVISVSDKGCGY